jgi:hypothetical protein
MKSTKKFAKILIILLTIRLCDSEDFSIGAHVHVFLMKMMGKHEVTVKKEPKTVIETFPIHYSPWRATTKQTTTTNAPTTTTTIAARTTTTTDYPYILAIETPTVQDDGSIKLIPVPIEEPLNSAIVNLLEKKELTQLPAGYFKIFVTRTTTTFRPTTTEASTSYDRGDVIRKFYRNKQKA